MNKRGQGWLEGCSCACDERTESEIVEHLAAVAPHGCVSVLANALIVETVDGGNLPAFVIASDQSYAVGIAYFEAEEEEEGFEGVKASVHKVAHEQIVCVGHVAPDSEEFHQVVELAMNVSAYCDGRVNLNDVAFFDEKLSRFVAQFAYIGFGDWTAGA